MICRRFSIYGSPELQEMKGCRGLRGDPIDKHAVVTKHSQSRDTLNILKVITYRYQKVQNFVCTRKQTNYFTTLNRD